MSLEVNSGRWRAAVTTAGSSTLADRWQITTRQWLEAQAEYRALYDAEVTNVSALRKAAQRLHDLGQLRKVLATGLNAQLVNAQTHDTAMGASAAIPASH